MLTIESAETIHSDGRHNAFTSMVRWRGRYYVAFRSAGTHAATWEDGWGDVPATYGRIMLLESADLRTWTPSVILDSEYDDRDPKLLTTEERLYVFSTTIIGPARLTMPQETYLSFTEDGRTWCRPVSAYRYNYGYWKPQTHGGIHYVAADVDVTPPNVEELDQQVELLSSRDGQLWQPVSVIVRASRCTETELLFLADGSLLAFTRPHYVSIARPPYTDWSVAGAAPDDRAREHPPGYSGPAAVQVGETLVFSCRTSRTHYPDDQPGRSRTGLFTVDPSDYSLTWHANLPTGWGGDQSYAGMLALDDVDVTGVTLSEEQHKVAERRAAEAGLSDRVRFLLEDYRHRAGRYDRIVSVGMFEHVGARHYREFFAKLRELLSDDGVAVLHSIGRMEPPGTTSAWLRKYIFPGGYTPALSEVLAALEREKLYVTDIEILRLHYAKTLAHWHRRFQDNRARIAELYDERFCRMWEFYLKGCEMAFRYWNQMVFQMQIAHNQAAVPLTRDYITDWERAQAAAELREAEIAA